MCIRDRSKSRARQPWLRRSGKIRVSTPCLLYTSDAADDSLRVDLGGRRIIKKYTDRLKAAQQKTNQKDAAILATGKIGGQTVCIFLLDFSFMGGSMGQYVGEAFKIGCQKSVELQCPFISIASSGGARMQEGIVSLMQLPKTVAAVNLLDQKKIPFISILTHPTTGGVSALSLIHI